MNELELDRLRDRLFFHGPHVRRNRCIALALWFPWCVAWMAFVWSMAAPTFKDFGVLYFAVAILALPLVVRYVWLAVTSRASNPSP
ncbi:hypothetical protein [Burkholderia vietnamiensis]|uniref:hypothetical protein n=1 Tax=Burkholderia vietnamiensis TaxID=60552 RepID=UPI0015939848|nr:hypothetical protein [Burkholderia vietnamiensis]